MPSDDRSGQAASLAAVPASGTATLDDLYRQHEARLRRYVAALDGAATVDDVCQDIWLQVALDLGSLESAEAFWPWVRTIARRTVYRTTRADRALRQRHRNLAAVAVDAEDSSGHMLVNAEDAARAREAMQSLSPTRRMLLEQRVINEVLPASIAAALGWTTNAVNVELSRARRQLRDIYKRLPLLVPVGLGRLHRRLEALLPASPVATVALFAVLWLPVLHEAPPQSEPPIESPVGNQPLPTNRRILPLSATAPAAVMPTPSNSAASMANQTGARALTPDATQRDRFASLAGIDGVADVAEHNGDFEGEPPPDVTIGSDETGTVRIWFDDMPAHAPARPQPIQLTARVPS